jgi:L-alanine-DL-glutamate epimerase-like enolase superfamily enzyme
VTVAGAVAVEHLDVSAYEVPTDAPESDGTLAWASTTIVVVEAHGGGRTGLGYTYGDASIAAFVKSMLDGVVAGCDAMAVSAAWAAMGRAIRNAGRPGLGAMAVSAVDIALWDLKARLLDLPLATVLDAVHETVPIYGSGGFTSYGPERVARQLGGWAERGIPRVKLKVGRHPEEDPARLDAARAAVGADVELFADANGAFSRKKALRWAERYAAEWGVSWLEEPVSSEDLDGLRFLRDRGPAGMDVAAGEYGYTLADHRALLEAGAVDCLQADVTRCGGISGLLRAAALAEAHGIDLSGHCAPAASAHPLSAVRRLRHLEYFHDHVRIEGMLFEGTLEPEGGALRPDRGRQGHGLELRGPDTAPYHAAGDRLSGGER